MADVILFPDGLVIPGSYVAEVQAAFLGLQNQQCGVYWHKDLGDGVGKSFVHPEKGAMNNVQFAEAVIKKWMWQMVKMYYQNISQEEANAAHAAIPPASESVSEGIFQ